LRLQTEVIRVKPFTLPYNDHDWDKVTSQGLGGYATWGKVGRELRLVELYIPENSISGSLDLSDCTALKILNCSYNQLTELNLSGCTALERLNCGFNQLTALDISGLTTLRELYCYDNPLKGLDASGLTSLVTVIVRGDPLLFGTLESLNLSGCTALEVVTCQYNNLTMLNLTGCASLKRVECEGNRLTFSTLPFPSTFEYKWQGFTELDQAKVAITIDATDTVDLSGENIGGSTTYIWKYANGKVVNSTLYSESNGIFTFTGLNATDVIYCEMTNAAFPNLTLATTSITIGMGSINYNAHDRNLVESQNLWAYATWCLVDGEARLAKLDTNGTYYAKGSLTGSLDLSGCEYLTEVMVQYNQLTGTLDVSGCTSLLKLVCWDNQLTKLNVSGCTALKNLFCGSNQLKELDISNNTALEELQCEDNLLTFSALPLPVDLPEGCEFYYLSRWWIDEKIVLMPAEVEVAIAASLLAEGKLDISVENVNGKTTYRWYYAGGKTVAPVTVVSPGVFSFGNIALGASVYCVMTNTEFPNLTLTTTTAKIVGEITLTPPNAPANFRSTSQTTNSVTLAWDSQSNLTGYKLEYKTSTSST
jgi:Leucine-rich repeat (LRR) protein